MGIEYQFDIDTNKISNKIISKGSNNRLTLEKLAKVLNRNNKYARTIIRIITGQDPKLSLRIFEWTVTNYSYLYNTNYELKINKKTISYDLHTDYQAQLKGFKKNRFDPFCRGDNTKFVIYYKTIDSENGEETLYEVTTNIAQLNFFYWVVKHKIHLYIKENYKNIYKTMRENDKKRIEEKKKSTTTRKKRTMVKKSFKRTN